MSPIPDTIILVAVPCIALIIATGLAWRATRPLALMLAPWAALPGLAVAIAGWPMGPVELPWLLLGTTLGLDETRRLFLLFTSGLWLAAGLYASAYHAQDPHRARMFGFFLFAMAGNLGLIVAADAVTFYLGFLGMGLAAYGLIIHIGDPPARRAALVYLVLVFLGEAMILPALWIAAVQAPSLALADVARGVAQSGDLTFWLLAAGLGVKAALVPLHVWLPLAHPVAPTPASAILSGAMVKAGLLGWLVLLPAGDMERHGFAAAFMILGLIGAFGAAFVGVMQGKPKTVLAYSSVSQLGLMTIAFGLALWSPQAAPLAVAAIAAYALHHALAKGALFLGVGCVDHAKDKAQRRRAWLLLLLPAAALSGLPLTSGIVAKTALKTASEPLTGAWSVALELALPLAAIGTTLLMARFLWLMLRAPAHEARPGLHWPWHLLLVAVAVVSFVPLALPEATILESLAPAAWWSALWPAAIGVVVALLALGRRWQPLPIREGDVLWPVLVLMRRLWGGRPRGIGAALMRFGHAIGQSWTRATSRALQGVSAGERALSRWPVMTGAMLLAVIGAVVLVTV